MYSELWSKREKAWGRVFRPIYNVARWAGEPWADGVEWDAYASLWKIPEAIIVRDVETACYMASDLVPEPLYFGRLDLCFPPLTSPTELAHASLWLDTNGRACIRSTATCAWPECYADNGDMVGRSNWNHARPGDVVRLAVLDVVMKMQDISYAMHLAREYAKRARFSKKDMEEVEHLLERIHDPVRVLAMG